MSNLMNTSAEPFKIEKDVPLPGGQALPPLPLEKMEPGDSFFVPGPSETKSKHVQTLRQRVIRYQTENEGTRFKVVKFKQGDTPGMRVYRLK